MVDSRFYEQFRKEQGLSDPKTVTFQEEVIILSKTLIYLIYARIKTMVLKHQTNLQLLELASDRNFQLAQQNQNVSGGLFS